MLDGDIDGHATLKHGEAPEELCEVRRFVSKLPTLSKDMLDEQRAAFQASVTSTDGAQACAEPHEKAVETHRVDTGKLPGILLVHIGMIVRLSDVMAPRLGLVKDKLGKDLSVVLHERDQMRLNDLPVGYRLFLPKFIAKGIWVQLQNYKRSPPSAHIMPDAEHRRRGEETAEDNADQLMADSAVFIELHSASFKCDVNINGTHETVEVLRWQFSLIHCMLRTACAAQA